MKDFFTSRFATITDFFSGQTLPTVDLKNLFSWTYWSENNPEPSSPYTVISLIAIIVLISALLIWRSRIKRAHQKASVYDWPINQLANLVAFIIVIALSYWFFRSQAIAYLENRLVILFSLLITVGWLGWIIIYLRRVIPTKRSQYLESERFFRYLPKKREKGK